MSYCTTITMEVKKSFVGTNPKSMRFCVSLSTAPCKCALTCGIESRACLASSLVHLARCRPCRGRSYGRACQTTGALGGVPCRQSVSASWHATSAYASAVSAGSLGAYGLPRWSTISSLCGRAGQRSTPTDRPSRWTVTSVKPQLRQVSVRRRPGAYVSVRLLTSQNL